MKEAQITLKISLDDKALPEKIDWAASDADFDGFKAADAMMVSLWDKHEKSSLSIDLWTKDMTVRDMNVFFYEKLIQLSETYERATSQPELAATFLEFAKEFAKRAEDWAKKQGEQNG